MHRTSWTIRQVERRIAFGLTWRLGTLALLLVALLAVTLRQVPLVQAAGGDPIIHWDSSMIYPGQNHGYPWGPVGENAIVHGANFPPDQQLRITVVPGNSNNDALICKQLGVTVGTAIANSSGTFDQAFAWPTSAGQVNEQYSICSTRITNGSVASSQDDGPFTVLASNPPVIDISSISVRAGDTIIVRGHNWVPPQQVTINIAGCAACQPGSSEVTSVSTTSAGLNSGSFKLAVTIPASTNPGKYVVDALTSSGLEAYYTTGVKHLTITAASATSGPAANPSATPLATTTQVATAAVTTTASDTPTSAANSDSSGNNGNSNTLLIIVMAAIAVVLFAIAGVLILMYMQRSRSKNLPVEPSQYLQNMQQYGSSPNFDQPQPMQPMQPVWLPSNFEQQTQQHGSYTSSFGQQMSPNLPSNNFDQGLPCMNCGRPLPSNTLVCSGCGVQQVQTQNPWAG